MPLQEKDSSEIGDGRRLTDIERQVADELAQLPRLQRLKTIQDVEGRNILAAAEPSRLVQIGLDALNRRIDERIGASLPGDPMWGALQSEFAADKTLRLKILRAEQFDSSLAFQRLINFLSLLQEVLGSNELRPLNLRGDFTSGEKELQFYGSLQLLLFRDDAGRRVAGCFDIEVPASAIERLSKVTNANLTESYTNFVSLTGTFAFHTLSTPP